jgi:hypothetical protein
VGHVSRKEGNLKKIKIITQLEERCEENKRRVRLKRIFPDEKSCLSKD